MTTTTPTSAPPAASGASLTSRRIPRLSGLTWLVWRQHRAAFWTGLAVTVAALAWFAYQRASMMAYLERTGWPESKSWALQNGFQEYSSRLGDTSSLVGLLVPVLVGVFLGAPLIANDLEQGTGKLVTSQAVSRGRWLTTKVGMAVAVVTLCTTALSAAYGWWLEPVAEADKELYWVAGSATGPVPVALTLLTMVGGVAIGMVLRRTLLSMAVTFGFAVTVQVLWAANWLRLGDARTVTTHDGVGEGAFPKLPEAAYDLDQSYLTGSGDLIGWGSCAEQTEQATNACLEKKDVVGWSVEYLPQSELPAVLWTGSAIMLALTAAFAVFVFWWGRKRLY
ncbi:ABC transporter [Streptomyces abyssalis]|uniref:ABC transporter n=1 Tax=Streptomyces abyssalis TaxID=933944 RepID=A0A1E7JNS7_9ACTN|nr:ABC transporter permease subunit [Streptomyces abyssalis]OEU86695.1 ABC transporter [Streptomyces abyssalis]OEU89918.1 ABC transporter [Streptomyces abyssalis]OEV04438.1 ABC transporter [Streptomyces nanshensis]